MYRLSLCVIVGTAAIIGLSAAAETPSKSLKETLLSRERRIVDAIGAKDKATLREMLAGESYAVTTGGGRQTGAEMLKSLDDVTVTSYSIDDVKAVEVQDDVGILTYRFTWEGSRNGKATSAVTVYATSVWALQKGEWKSVFYQETPIED